MLGHNGICFGAGISVGYQRLRFCYSGAVPRYCYIWFHTQTIALEKVTDPQNKVSHLVPDQAIVPGQTIVLYMVPCPDGANHSFGARPNDITFGATVAGFDPENPQHSKIQDSTPKTHGTASNRIQPGKQPSNGTTFGAVQTY